jgi:hypothetical protein
MNLANKVYKNNKTGETIKVIDSFENIVILENKNKLYAETLLNPDLYTEQIDINNFLNPQGTYNSIAETIKNIPLDKINYEDEDISVQLPTNEFAPGTNESAIIMSSEDDERAEIAKKYGIDNNAQEAVNKQNEAFSKLLGEGSDVTNEPAQRIEVKREGFNQVQQQNQTPVLKSPVEDPIITMFKNTKRIKEFSISFDIKDKIPRLDFIEMMEDSYNISIIDYLATEFTDKLLKNPQIIENMIRAKIKEMVYKPDIKKKDDLVEKEKPVRKPRQSKKQSEKNDNRGKISSKSN